MTSLASLALVVGCGDDGAASDTNATTPTTTMDPTAGDDTPDDDGVDDDGMTADDTMNMTSVDTTAGTDTTPGTDDMMGTDTGSTSNDVVFRFASLNVRDPHFWADTLIGCRDVTDGSLAGNPGVNVQFNAAINEDAGPMDTPDGNLDLSLMLIFRGLDQTDAATGTMDFANGSCPAAGGDCDLLAGSMVFPADYTSSTAGPCEHVEAADLGGYDPAPGTTPGPCFSAGPATVQIVTESFNLELVDTEIAGTYTGDPATSLMSGTLRGFLSTATAEATMLPADLTESTGATNVAGLLAGHPTSCAGQDDRDGDGWWFYADFTALSSTWAGD